MKKIWDYLKNWNFTRVLKLALGLFILGHGMVTADWMLAALGGLFSLTTLFNVGCCNTSNCQVTYSKKQ